MIKACLTQDLFSIIFLPTAMGNLGKETWKIQEIDNEMSYLF